MKTKLLIIALALPLVFGCENSDGDDNGGNAGGYDPGKEEPISELPPLEDVDDVCTKMVDRNFMTYCYENFDVNKDGKVSMLEANALSNGGLVIECNTATDFTGIEYFTNLTKFKSSSVKILNLGYNKKLVSIDCSGSSLETIDLRYNTLVSEIGFRDCKELTKVLLADEAPLESIKDYCFSGCSLLSTVSLPDNCKTIGAGVFYKLTKLSKIKFPKNLTSIGYCAFSGCSGLTSVTFPNGLTSIGYYAFSGCSGLTSVTFPNGLTSIGYCAFYDCSGLTSVTLPDGLTLIDYCAFEGCSGLTSVTLPDGLTSIGNSAFCGCSGLTSVTLPDGLTSIGNSAFCGCSGLTSVTFPDGLTSIRDFAFCSCSGLTSVTFPDGLTSIGYSAFSGCSGLTSVTFPDGLTSIGYSAFSGCSGLTSVTFPNGLTSIDYCAFCECSSLSDVRIFSVNPPTLKFRNEFSAINSNAVLRVPEGCVDIYKSSDWGSYFKTIVEIDD